MIFESSARSSFLSRSCPVSANELMPPRMHVVPPNEGSAQDPERHAGQSEIEPRLIGLAACRPLEQVHREPNADTQSKAETHEVTRLVVDRPQLLVLRQSH